jgi:S-(hydroxymethyl)glutathione dehydrogenase / alcohol dehydrogenase
MKAAVCREFGKPLTIEEVALAEPAAHEVKVRLAACAVCHSDIHYWEGAWGGELPAVYGHEASGVVEAVGPGVVGLAPGDHAIVTLIRSCGSCHYCLQGEPVLCETRFPLDRQSPLRARGGGALVQGLRTGAFAEYVTVDASQVAAIPKDVPLEAASLLACGVITGFGAVTNTARMPAGVHAVVIGTGGVGLNTVQGAALSGARTIIALDLSETKLAAAQKFGATHTINPRTTNAAEAIKALTGGRGADYVFVTVGVKSAFEQAFTYIAKSGTVVVVGMPANGVMAEFEPGNLAAWGQKVLGSKMGSARLGIDVPMLVELYRQKRLKLDELISGRYRLEEINEAFASVLRGEALRNVIVFS